MSERATVVLEVLCVLGIAVGVWAIYWPAALIIGCGLLLLGLQGVGRADRTVE